MGESSDPSTKVAAHARPTESRKQGPHPPNARNGSQQNGTAGNAALRSAQRPLDVTDNDSFPTLSGGKSKAGKSKKASDMDEGEISGDRAKMYLEELKRKKDEAQAAQTAYGAAESVLGGDD